MAIRMSVPPEHNDTTETFKRTLSSCGFICNSSDAVACQQYKTPLSKRVIWSAMKWGSVPAVIGAALLLVAQFSNPASASDKPKDESRIAALRMAAINARVCPGMHADWIDAKTVQCLKETP